MLPNLLEIAKMLPTRYYRYGYDSGTNMGRWYSAEGPLLPDLHLPVEVKFAVLRYETPVEHYTLLERS